MLSWTRSDILKIIQALKPNTFVFLWVLNVEFYGSELLFSLMAWWVLFAFFDLCFLIRLKSNPTRKYIRDEFIKKISMLMWIYSVVMMLWSINYNMTNEALSASLGAICLIAVLGGIYGQLRENAQKLIVITGIQNWYIHRILTIIRLVDRVIDYKIESKGKEYLDWVKIKKDGNRN